ncbi:MAG: abortive infection family protein [Desulfomicrobium escambiense]|nr:abortive infection family protein [Desulfomicrobium escambiense]
MNIKLHPITLGKIAEAIVGDGTTPAPYKSWKQLQEFIYYYKLPELNANNSSYDLSSRVKQAKAVLIEINDTPKLKEVIEAIFDKRYFFEGNINPDDTAKFINDYLTIDNYKIVKTNNDKYQLRKLTENKIIDINAPFTELEASELNQEFIIKQIDEARKRIDEENYWGAITVAKSLLEAVFTYLDIKINDKSTINHNDDLIKQYNAIKKMLNLDPSRKDLSDSLKQILTGLNSIICGLAFFRNKMSDAHRPTYKPSKHHAILAVNASYTLAQFLFDTFNYQNN